MDQIWGLPVIKNLAMPVGTALVGDFVRGGILYTREGVFARTSDADQDDFCLAPDVRFLTAEGEWVECGSLRTGDELLAFDEHGDRRWRRSTVTHSEPSRA